MSAWLDRESIKDLLNDDAVDTNVTVRGWVRNRPDGSVEILAEGEELSIRELHGWAQKGPSAARVDRVDTRWRGFTGEFADFRIVE